MAISQAMGELVPKLPPESHKRIAPRVARPHAPAPPVRPIWDGQSCRKDRVSRDARDSHLRELSLRSLRVFEAAASSCSFSRASESLGLSQAAVSQQIRQLELDVGMKLFDTSVRPVQVTDAGYELLRHARTILAQVSVAYEALVSLDGQFRGRLCIGVVQPANYFAAQLIDAFRSRHPGVRLKLIVNKRDELLAMLADHRIEMAIGGYPSVQAEVDVEAFARNPHFLVAHAGHRLAGRRGLTWEDLRNEAFVFREQGSTTRHFLEHILQTQGLQVGAELELEGNEAVKQAVMIGLGVSFLSAHVMQTELEVGKLVALDLADMPKSLDWCVWRRREPRVDSVSDAFRTFLLQEGAALCGCPFPSALRLEALPC